MSKENKIQLFQKQSVRTHWDEEKELWYFSIIDVIAILIEQKDYQGDRKSTRLNSSHTDNLVCRLLLEKKK